MRSTLFIGAIALTAGAIAGLAAGALAVRFYEPPQQPLKIVYRERDRAGVPALPVLGDGEAPPRKQAPAQPAYTQTSEQGQTERPFTPAELAERWKAKWQAKIAGVQNEARDPAWAIQAELAFEKDFRERAHVLGARLVRLDCRSTSCLGRVEWDSYELAKSRFRDVVHADYSTRCANSIDIGDAPEDRTRAHQAIVVFQCERAPSGEVGGG